MEGYVRARFTVPFEIQSPLMPLSHRACMEPMSFTGSMQSKDSGEYVVSIIVRVKLRRFLFDAIQLQSPVEAE